MLSSKHKKEKTKYFETGIRDFLEGEWFLVFKQSKRIIIEFSVRNKSLYRFVLNSFCFRSLGLRFSDEFLTLLAFCDCGEEYNGLEGLPMRTKGSLRLRPD